MEIIDGAALFGAGAVAFALKAYLHLANVALRTARATLSRASSSTVSNWSFE